MTSRHSEPRDAGARGVLKTDLAGWLIASEHTAEPSEIQAARLARRFGLTPAVARAVAQLHFVGRPH